MISFVKSLFPNARKMFWVTDYEKLGREGILSKLNLPCEDDQADSKILELFNKRSSFLTESLFKTDAAERADEGKVICVSDITLYRFHENGTVCKTGVYEGHRIFPTVADATTTSFIDACVSSESRETFNYCGAGRIVFPCGKVIHWEKDMAGQFSVVTWLSKNTFLLGVYSDAEWINSDLSPTKLAVIPSKVFKRERSLLFKLRCTQPLAVVETFARRGVSINAVTGVALFNVDRPYNDGWMLVSEIEDSPICDFTITTTDGFKLPLD